MSEETGGPQATGGGFPGGAYLELSVTGGRWSDHAQAIVPGALRLRDLADLLAMAQAHGVALDTTVILERASLDGTSRVRATGAGVRVHVEATNLRPAEPARSSIGAAAVEVVPDEEVRGRRGIRQAGELADEVIIRPPNGFDPRVAEHRVQLGAPFHLHRTTAELRGCVVDPSILEGLDGLEQLADDPGDHGVGDEPAIAAPAPGESFAELGGVVAETPSFLRPRPVRDDPQA